MPAYPPQAIANAFLRLRASPMRPAQMLIQKLIYFAHGWNLAINDAPLTAEPPEAWANGPVYRAIWDHVRDYGYKGPDCTLVDPYFGGVIEAPLTDAETGVVVHVWRKYGQKSPLELSRMTHQPGTPWSTAYYQRGQNALLRDEEIRDYYTALAMAGREQQQPAA